MAFNLAFDVIKFSESITPPGPVQIDWTHILGANLQVVLEGSDDDFVLLRMDVVQGTTFLERLNVGEYIDRSKRVRNSKDRDGVSLKLEELPIFAIGKDPVLALRYQLNGKARRVQLRLKRSEDFQQMVSILSNRGMDFSPLRPNTARQNTSSGHKNASQQDGRPLTSSTSRIVQRTDSSARSRPSPFHLPDIEAGSLSQPPAANALPLTNRAGQLVAPAREFSRDADQAGREILPSRPSSAQTWRSHPSQSLRPDVYDVQQGSDEMVSRSNANMESSGNAAEDFFQFSVTGSEVIRDGFKLPPQRGWSSGGIKSHASALSSEPIESRPSTALSMTSGASIFADTLENEIPPERALPFKATGNLRPSSAISMPSAASLSIPDTLEHEIPPRRDLPFKVPGSRGGGGSSSTLRPGSALPPPSKKAKIMSDRPKTASSAQKRPSETNAYRSGSNDASEPRKTMRLPTQSNLSFAASKSAPIESEDGHENPLPMKDLIFGTRPSSTIRLRMGSTLDAPHEIESPPDSPGSQHPAAIPQATRFPAASTTLSAEHNGHRSRLGPAASPVNDSQELSLDDYASQTPEARQKALDRFMMDSLQDPSFTTLCEDTEQCWRRIALGL